MKEKSALPWLIKTTKSYRNFICILTVLEIVISAFSVCYALVMKQMVDCAVAMDIDGFVIGIIGFGLLVITQLIVRIITRQLSESVRSSIENTLKRNLFRVLLCKKYESVSSVHSEEWMNRMTSDTALCACGITDIIPGFVGMMIRLVGSLTLIFCLQSQLAVIIVPGAILFCIITVVLRNPLKRFHKDVQEKDGKVRVYLQERISSMLVVRSFGLEDIAAEKVMDIMQEHKKARMRKSFVSNICNGGFSLAINGMYILGIGYCGYGIIHGVVTFGTLTAIIQLIGQLQAPLSSLGSYVPQYYTTIASAERLMEAESYEDMQTEHVLSKNEVITRYQSDVKEIVFDKVSFQYSVGENDKVLNQVSFTIEKGDYVAITGASGCGKSTMLKVLMGIYRPQVGTAMITMLDGSFVSVENMRRLFAYVPQGNFLMGGSIRDVITFGQNVKDGAQQIEKVICLACADFVYKLPRQLDTILGEKGSGLSEGQMQRIAIARALYSDCPILILDESTSALDNKTQEQLLLNLKQLTDKTVLIVSHRPQVLSICNKRLAFDQGCVMMLQEE